jgi:hypothetical protein
MIDMLKSERKGPVMRRPGNNISSIFGKLIRIKFLLNNFMPF